MRVSAPPRTCGAAHTLCRSRTRRVVSRPSTLPVLVTVTCACTASPTLGVVVLSCRFEYEKLV